MEQDWSFLITERPDRPNKPQSLDSDHSPFSWAYVTAWLIEMTANANQQSRRSVPVLSVQQVIDHSDIEIPVTDPEIFLGFGGSRLHAVALENLSKKKIGFVAADNYEESTLPLNATDAAVKLSGWEVAWAFEDYVMHVALAKGPVAACIRVTQKFIDYNGGIYCKHNSGPSGSDFERPITPDIRKRYQFVLVVGYGTEDGVNYWKIFNPWSDWGECDGSGIRGFGKVCREKSCGFMILNCAVTCHVEIVSNKN